MRKSAKMDARKAQKQSAQKVRKRVKKCENSQTSEPNPDPPLLAFLYFLVFFFAVFLVLGGRFPFFFKDFGGAVQRKILAFSRHILACTREMQGRGIRENARSPFDRSSYGGMSAERNCPQKIFKSIRKTV